MTKTETEAKKIYFLYVRIDSQSDCCTNWIFLSFFLLSTVKMLIFVLEWYEHTAEIREKHNRTKFTVTFFARFGSLAAHKRSESDK